MSVDWDKWVLGPLNGVFGEPVVYTPANGSPFTVTGVFDTAYVPVALDSDPTVLSVRPVCGVRLSDFPAGWDPSQAQGDQMVRSATNIAYIVKAGKNDGHGHARLELNRLSL